MTLQQSAERFIVINTGEKTYECEVRRIALSELRIDPRNPRLLDIGITQGKLETYDQEYISQAILSIAELTNLKKSILSTNGIQEALYVKQQPDGNYSVREGNRRTLSLLDIQQSIQAKQEGYDQYQLENFTNPECIIYPEQMSEREILLHIAQMHVTGKHPWGAFEKAGMVKRMIDEHGLDQDTIAETIGMSKSYIKQYLWAYERTLEYHRRFNDDENWTGRFSHFQKVYSKKFLKDEWWINPKNQEKFMHWVHQNKIPHAFRISGKTGLAEIVKTQEHLRWFEKDGNDLNEAVDRLKTQKKKVDGLDSIQDELIDSIRFLRSNLERLTTGKMKEIRNDRNQLALFTEAQDLLTEKIKEIKG